MLGKVAASPAADIQARTVEDVRSKAYQVSFPYLRVTETKRMCWRQQGQQFALKTSGSSIALRYAVLHRGKLLVDSPPSRAVATVVVVVGGSTADAEHQQKHCKLSVHRNTRVSCWRLGRVGMSGSCEDSCSMYGTNSLGG